MQFYFFKSPDKVYSALFRKFAVKQNVATARVLSVIMLFLASAILISTWFVDYHTVAPNFERHGPGTFMAIASVVYYLSFFILKRVRVRHKTAIRQFFSVGYAMVFLASSMWLTFLAQNNPKNTVTFLLLGTFTVSVLWVLEAWESILIAALTLAAFYFGLQYFQTDPTSFFQNSAVATIVVVIFFAVSRVTYSYHYNYFQQLKLVEQKNREIGLVNNTQKGILKIVGHDLRNPITNISAIVKLLNEIEVNEQEKKEYYDLILASVRDADNIIHELMDAALGQEKELQKTEVCLNDFLKAIYLEWQHRMPNGQHLALNEPLTTINAYIHTEKMRRVLNNLIDNATKFTPAGGTITLELKKIGDKTRISVNDNGIGVPAELQPFLFERFSRAGRSGLNGEKSYGLGLSICRQIVQEHAGELLLESIEDKGASFHIDIPQPSFV